MACWQPRSCTTSFPSARVSGNKKRVQPYPRWLLVPTNSILRSTTQLEHVSWRISENPSNQNSQTEVLPSRRCDASPSALLLCGKCSGKFPFPCSTPRKFWREASPSMHNSSSKKPKPCRHETFRKKGPRPRGKNSPHRVHHHSCIVLHCCPYRLAWEQVFVILVKILLSITIDI